MSIQIRDLLLHGSKLQLINLTLSVNIGVTEHLSLVYRDIRATVTVDCKPLSELANESLCVYLTLTTCTSLCSVSLHSYKELAPSNQILKAGSYKRHFQI